MIQYRISVIFNLIVIIKLFTERRTKMKKGELEGDACPDCDSSGKVFNKERDQADDCSNCRGIGLINLKNACQTCKGTGLKWNGHGEAIYSTICKTCNGSQIQATP